MMLARVPALIAMLLAVVAVPPVVEAPGVRIAASIDNQIYTWTLTGLGDRPITGFEVEVTGTYIYTGPDGWQTEALGEDRFRAWTTDPFYAIGRGVSRSFTARVSSVGAPLGVVQAWVETGFGAERVEIPAVWGPVPKRASMVMLVAATLVAAAAAQTVLVERRQRSTSAVAGK